ncbi:MAG: DUF4458 domain-containing protein [Candidatus Cryptobacteroides sp.]
MKSLKYHILMALAAVSALLFSCAKEEAPDNREKDYGYVQFKLYKEASYEGTKAVVPELDYLKDAAKVMVMLQYGDIQISQTLTVSASDDEAAEYGLRSEKLKLVAGEYKVNAFTLFDRLDGEIYNGGESGSFTVVPGGLTVRDILAKVTPRGKARFTLVKDFEPATRAATREYTFDEVSYADITVKETATGVKTSFNRLHTDFSVDYDDSGENPKGYLTSTLACDTLVSLKAGSYVIDAYTLYDSGRKLLENSSSVKSSGFTVTDNKTAEAKVPVTLRESDEYLKDYFALKEIWESLDGSNWYYSGQDWSAGANWNFNKDPDLWGDQPGVQLHANGRVALINISDFGFRGDLSPAIGQLSELVELYLGTHNDYNLLEYDPTVQPGSGRSDRMERHKEYLRLVHPATQLSEPVARALLEHDIHIPEIDLYTSMKEDEIIEKGTGRMLIRPMDMVHGKLCNGLRSLPDEIGTLSKLEKLYVANGELSTLPNTLGGLVSLTDLEIYNCPKMLTVPESLREMPALVSVNIANNLQWNSEEAARALDCFANGAAAGNIQILYMNQNNLTKVDGASIKNMKKLGLLDLSNNKIEEITEAFGEEIGIVQLYLDNNRLSSMPVDENGLFFKMDDVETFSVKNNLFTEFPDIFSAKSVYVMGSVDFSYNHISGFQNAGNGYKGLKVETLTLNNNPELTTYPTCLAESKSVVANLSFRGCSLDNFPKGSFTGENVKYIRSIDLSYNHLDDLPAEMNAVNIPYLYGIDLSYNRFASFPFEPLDSGYLTVFGIRGQRNENGERCLSEWPTGLYNHKGLRGFYIGSNNLGKISDTISTLIYYLDISDNPEIVFDASDICYAYAAGAYYLIYDKTQDIRGCDYIALD